MYLDHAATTQELTTSRRVEDEAVGGGGSTPHPHLLPVPASPRVDVYTTEYTECWPCPLFDILLNKYYPAG
jgi:hypothetical protein